eukprot:366331-Chlamydomonas_euryale.AAC.11
MSRGAGPGVDAQVEVGAQSGCQGKGRGVGAGGACGWVKSTIADLWRSRAGMGLARGMEWRYVGRGGRLTRRWQILNVLGQARVWNGRGGAEWKYVGRGSGVESTTADLACSQAGVGVHRGGGGMWADACVWIR